MTVTSLLTVPADPPTNAHVLALYRHARGRSRELDGYQDWPIDTKEDCDRKRDAAEQTVELARYLTDLMISWPNQYHVAAEICDMEQELEIDADIATGWVILRFDPYTAATWLDATMGKVTPALAAALRDHWINPSDERLSRPHRMFPDRTWLDALLAGLDTVDSMLSLSNEVDPNPSV